MSLRHWAAPASLALLGHAGLFAAMGPVRPPRSAAVVPQERVQPGEIALELEPEPSRPGAEAPAPPPAPAAAPAQAPHRGHAGVTRGALAARESTSNTPPTDRDAREPGTGAGEPADSPSGRHMMLRRSSPIQNQLP